MTEASAYSFCASWDEAGVEDRGEVLQRCRRLADGRAALRQQLLGAIELAAMDGADTVGGMADRATAERQRMLARRVRVGEARAQVGDELIQLVRQRPLVAHTSFTASGSSPSRAASIIWRVSSGRSTP